MSITEREAFLAMSTFLREFYSRSDRSIAELIVDIGLESDGSTFDRAAWFDWTRCVQMVRRSGGVEITEAMREEFAVNLNSKRGAIHLLPETFPVSLDANGYGPQRGDYIREGWPNHIKWDLWADTSEVDVYLTATRVLAISARLTSIAELGGALGNLAARFKRGIVLDVSGLFNVFAANPDLFEQLIRMLSGLVYKWLRAGDRAHVVISGPPSLLEKAHRIIEGGVQDLRASCPSYQPDLDVISYAP